MKRKKKIGTAEERAARRARTEARIRDLQGHIDRITAELAAKKRPGSDPAGV
jgi:uncharacterized small protein (DUF1192 family)